jgi:hypothetical protein
MVKVHATLNAFAGSAVDDFVAVKAHDFNKSSTDFNK